MRYDTIIIGAGLTGAICAFRDRCSGKKVLVLERSKSAGGLCKSEQMALPDGNLIDVHTHGPHIFHTNKRKVWDFVNKVTPFVPFFLNVKATAADGKVYSLPFNLNLFNQLWGCSTPMEAESIFGSLSEGTDEMTLEDYSISCVGREIYELFIKGYTEKQWGMKCSELPSSIIRRIPISFAWDNRIHKCLYSGVPEIGWSGFIEKLLHGCHVSFEIDGLKNKDILMNSADKVIYTGRLDEFWDFRYGELEYRHVKHENKIRETPDYQGCPVMNFTSSLIPITRRMEWKHFPMFVESDYTITTDETPSRCGNNSIAAYPVLTDKNLSLKNKYVECINRFWNVEFAGRLAEYRYYDMDSIIERFMP